MRLRIGAILVAVAVCIAGSSSPALAQNFAAGAKKGERERNKEDRDKADKAMRKARSNMPAQLNEQPIQTPAGAEMQAEPVVEDAQAMEATEGVAVEMPPASGTQDAAAAPPSPRLSQVQPGPIPTENPPGLREVPGAPQSVPAETPVPVPAQPVDATAAPGVTQVGQPPAPTPELPVNQNRPKIGVVNGDMINVDFQDQTLSYVVESLAPLIGKVFDIPPEIAAQKVTLITHTPVPKDMAYALLESILASRQFKMVETLDGRLIKIRPIAEDQEQAPLIIDGRRDPEGFESFEIHVVQIEHAAAEELQQLLTSSFKSKTGKIDVYARTNTLIINDTAVAIRGMLALIEEVDVPGYDDIVDFFWLKFTRAEVISEQIQQVLLGGDQGQAAAAAPTAPQVRQPVTIQSRTARPIPGQPQQTVVGSASLTLRIVPDERLNALIVVASAPLMEQVRDLVDKLDTATPAEANNMHVRELQHADAEKVEAALQSLITGSPQRSTASSSSSGGTTGLTGGGGVSPGLGGGSNTGGGQGDVNVFEKKVTITRYDQTNALLVIASPQDFKVLDEVIARLDVPSRQVHVEAMIMEVGINDRYRLAVESAGLTANDYFALNNIVSLANVLTEGPLAAISGGDSPVLSAGIIDGTTTLSIPDGAGGVVTQEVPNIPLLLTALESLTALDVLSRPSLTTVDNEEASIIDGQNVPIPTGSQRTLDSGGSLGTSFFNTTTRQDLGIKLTVTPQISEGSYVFLDLAVEVSRPIQSDVGIDPNTTGLTYSKSEVKNKVVVRDGSTGILGGLISESTDRGKRQTPILGDIPGLGWLFRRTDDRRVKRNLVVLLTPHILKEGIDFDRLTQSEMEKVETANADVYFEKGFIKKVSRKHYLRNEFRPTEAAINEVQGEPQFEKGDAKR